MEIRYRKTYFEIMRIVASALVIFNHLPAYTYYMYSSGIVQWVYMFFTMLTRINVPLFLMVSGALLLGRTEDFVQVKKRVVRFVVTIIVFNAGIYILYAFRDLYKNGTCEISLYAFAQGTFSGGIRGAGAYWYLYAYLGMLLTLPFLQKIAQSLTKMDVVVLVGLHFLLASVIPMTNILLKGFGMESLRLSDDINVPLATVKQFFYPLIGYYIETNIDVAKLKRRQLSWMCLAGLLGISISCACTYWEGVLVGDYSQNFVQLFDYVTAIVAFFLIKVIWLRLKEKVFVSNRSSDVICWLGSLTFGIYLLDPCLKILFYGRYERWISSIFPGFFCSFGWVIISMTVGGALTNILRKFPILRRLL